jgi:ABC-2 type transport system ATP-binding protein
MRDRLAIEVRGLRKTFWIPGAGPDTLKERVLHPFTIPSTRELKVLRDVSFEVERGEFFGVTGRNGSGKSTLLKLLASIYRADGGRIRVAGTIAPVIELGVGFQPEMTAKDNVILNALMLGLTPTEAKRRFDAVIEFAELRDFVDLKLKNYSSGMRARLAFAIATQAEADILLLDEVLAVGDPPFQRRCQETFDELKRTRRSTVVLVTHAMSNIERYCDRAMLLERGRIEHLGSPSRIAASYAEIQSSRLGTPVPAAPAPELQPEVSAGPTSPVRIAAVRLLDASGEQTAIAGPAEPLRILLTLDADRPAVDPRVLIWLLDAGGGEIFASDPIALGATGQGLGNGRRVDLAARIENRLMPGSYFLRAMAATGPRGAGAERSQAETIAFEVAGDPHAGVVSLDHQVRIFAEPARRPNGIDPAGEGGR